MDSGFNLLCINSLKKLSQLRNIGYFSTKRSFEIGRALGNRSCKKPKLQKKLQNCDFNFRNRSLMCRKINFKTSNVFLRPQISFLDVSVINSRSLICSANNCNKKVGKTHFGAWFHKQRYSTDFNKQKSSPRVGVFQAQNLNN